MSVAAAEASVLSARSVRRQVRELRTSGDRSVIQAVAATYYALCVIGIGVGVFGPSIVGFVTAVLAESPELPLASGFRSVLPAGGLVAAGFGLWLARQYGPAVLKPEEVTWLLRAPVGRTGLLARRVVGLSMGFAAAGAVIGAGLTAGGSVTVAGVLAAAAIGLATGLALVLVAMVGQLIGEVGDRVVRGLWSVLVTLGVLTAGLTVVPSAAGLGTGFGLAAYEATRWSGPWGWPALIAAQGMPAVVAGSAAVLVAALVAVAVVALLPRLPHGSIATASARFAMLAGAATMMDPGSLATADEARRAGRRRPNGRLPRGRWWRGPRMLLAQDLLLIRRRWPRLVFALVLTAAPALAAVLGGMVAALVVLVTGALWVARVGTGAAGRESDAPGLARLIALSPETVRTMRLVVPVILSAGWGVLAFALLALVAGTPVGLWILLGAAVGPAWALGALRMAGRGPVRHELPVLVTPGGLIPTGPVLWAVTGVDIGVLLAIPTLTILFTGGSVGPAWVVGQIILSGLGLAWPQVRRLFA